MLKKTLSILLISRWLIVIFVISLAGVAAIPVKKDIHSTRILAGTIINKNDGLLTVGSNEHPGKILTLSTGPHRELPAYHTGDRIIIEYSPDYIIRTISKRG